MPKFGTKNALFGSKRSYLKSTPLEFALLQNFATKQKCLNLGPKMSELGIFGLEFENNSVIFEIRTIKFVKNESLTHTVNFGRGSTFS